MDVSQALRQRYSARAFTEQVPSAQLVQSLLEDAARAPSGGNIQPWRALALTGEPLRALLADVAAAPVPDQAQAALLSYPDKLWEPYRSRRFSNGEAMYQHLAIAREDTAARMAQNARNAQFFGAPVVILVLTDARMGRPQWLDLGCFLQSFMLRATEEGLGTCVQGFWRRYNDVLQHSLGYPAEYTLAYALALGYVDEAAIVNGFRTERAPWQEWGELRGF